MYIAFRFFNNVILMLVNFLIAIFFGRRLFLVMTRHYKLISEIMEFNLFVREARDTLDYITSEIAGLMNGLEGDIGEELSITHKLTELSTRMAVLVKRYGEIEERVIEVMRMNENTESVLVGTPKDIDAEVQKVLAKIKKNRIEFTAKPLTPATDNVLTM